MSFGKNLQYLRRLYRNLTQEGLSEKLNVSRQTVSKWETDDAMPEMDKALELCKIFNCTLDNLFRDEMSVPDGKYSNLRIEMVKTICCVFNLQKRGFSCKISKINLISSITKMQKGDTTWKV